MGTFLTGRKGVRDMQVAVVERNGGIYMGFKPMLVRVGAALRRITDKAELDRHCAGIDVLEAARLKKAFDRFGFVEV